MKQLKTIGYIVLIFLLVVGFLTTINTFNRKDQFNINKTTVVKELKELNRLETAQFTIEKVIDSGTQNNLLKDVLFGDRILFIAHGQVIAGFDLSKLKEKNVHVGGKSISITLPPPEILVSSLDNNKTRVYDRRRGLLTQGDKDLESQVRAAALQAIVQAACDGKILDESTTNARKQLTALFSSLGFSDIRIDIPQGNC